jgi:salicylate hydroxylase
MAADRKALPRIAVLGGGIGGLAVAAFLHREGLSSTVYEQARRLAEVGAGLVVAPNAARQLRKLDALEEFRKRAVRLDTGWEFRRWQDGTVLSSENLAAACEQLYGEHTYTAHRADLLSVIGSRVPEQYVALGRKCVGIETVGGALRLNFADGRSAEADVVIGADGVHSIVRDALFGTSPAAYSGLCARARGPGPGVRPPADPGAVDRTGTPPRALPGFLRRVRQPGRLRSRG